MTNTKDKEAKVERSIQVLLKPEVSGKRLVPLYNIFRT